MRSRTARCLLAFDRLVVDYPYARVSYAAFDLCGERRQHDEEES
jgi:hypothetical protein